MIFKSWRDSWRDKTGYFRGVSLGANIHKKTQNDKKSA